MTAMNAPNRSSRSRSRALSAATRVTRRQVLAGAAASGAAVCLSPFVNPVRALADQAPLVGGTLQVARLQEPGTLDIHKTPWLDYLIAAMQETYLDRDLKGNFIPCLAERWEVRPDNLAVTLHLRHGVTLQDGTPLTARVTKATWDRMLDPSTNSPGAFQLGTIKQVEVVDDMTVRMVFSAPFAPIFSSLTSAYLAPISTEALTKYGAGYGTHPVGAGPFMFERWAPGDSLSVVRYPAYRWPSAAHKNRGPAYMNRIVFRFVPDENARNIGLRTGEVDVAGDAPVRAALALQNDKRYRILKLPATGINYLGFQCQKAPWNDARVRQAVAWAITNRDEIIRTAYDGFGQPMYAPLSPNIVPGYDPTLRQVSYEQNYQKAAALLAEAGWKDKNAQGILLRNGQPFTAELWVTNDPVYQRAAELIQRYLHQAGIDLKLTVMDDSTLFASTQKGVHDMIFAYYGQTDPDIMFYFFHSSRLSTTNRVHYLNPAMDKLLEQGRTTLDVRQRAQIYRQAQEIILRDAAWVPLVLREFPIIANYRVRDFVINPVSQNWLLSDTWLNR